MMKYIKYRPTLFLNEWIIESFEDEQSEKEFLDRIKRIENIGVEYIIEFIDQKEFTEIGSRNFKSWR